ncbi:MAG: energy-coupling factor transporter transmembrane protein EcfT [Bacilli bacterium]|jgi:energy-coupling factor transport system permease protein|nr:energy-coupling factor transporter transmembrane protein EcfT [Bacilli bacterium]
MLNNITIGAYIPTNSIIHRMHPLSKIICLFILLIGVFLINDILVYAISTIFIIILILIAKLSPLRMLKQIKILYFMFVFLFILNIFMLRTGPVAFNIGSFIVYWQAINQTVIILFRLISMVILSSILTMSTKPLDLTLGIEQCFSPLKRFHFPAHEIAMMISIALRFIPTLIEETNKIMIAQTSRGVDFKAKKLSIKIKAVIALLIPLFVSAFKRAEELANAMEARGYNPSATRTRFIQHAWMSKDSVAIIISCLYLGAIICYLVIN